MNAFLIDSSGPDLNLQLIGEVTIEHACELHAALRDLLSPARGLLIDAGKLTRVDAAALQVLIAACQISGEITVVARSDAWDQACRRFALEADLVGTPKRNR